MSSFWNIFGGKEEKPNEENPSEDGEDPSEPNAQTVAAAAAAQQAAAAARTGGTSVAPAKPGAQQQGQFPSSSVAPEQQRAAMSQPQPPQQRSAPRYGIDDAMRLMRTLPVDENVDLVVRVIKRTLESLSVRVPDIIEDASRRQEALKSKIGEHQTAIAQFEREIELRRYEINRLEDELAETTTTRERLQLAEALPVTPPAPKVATAGGSGIPPSMPRKPDAVPASTAAPSAKAPPLPTSFRPKPTTAEASKRPPPADAPPRINDDDDDDDDQPVASSDMIDKS